MSRFSAWVLFPLLMIGLAGASFSLCQGFMMDAPQVLPPEQCCGDLCHKMCQLVQVDTPAVAQKPFSQTAEVAILAVLSTSCHDLEAPRPVRTGMFLDLTLHHEYASAEVYLVNAAFLI
jgi:hypothetical protein